MGLEKQTLFQRLDDGQRQTADMVSSLRDEMASVRYEHAQIRAIVNSVKADSHSIALLSRKAAAAALHSSKDAAAAVQAARNSKAHLAALQDRLSVLDLIAASLLLSRFAQTFIRELARRALGDSYDYLDPPSTMQELEDLCREHHCHDVLASACPGSTVREVTKTIGECLGFCVPMAHSTKDIELVTATDLKQTAATLLVLPAQQARVGKLIDLLAGWRDTRPLLDRFP